MFKKNNDIPAINNIVFSCIPNLPTVQIYNACRFFIWCGEG